MNVYDLMRSFWDWSFENPEKIKPNHSAVYFFVIEHCNRLGWKEKFGLPTTMVMEAVGIKSYNTYKKTLDDLVEWEFVMMIERSKNQYSSNIIALSNFDKAHNKALDKALMKHTTKQSESTQQSIDSIDIQIYKSTNLQEREEFLQNSDTPPNSKNLKNEVDLKNEEQEKEKKVPPKKRKKFVPPSLQEVQEYCNERNNGVDAWRWYNFYQAKGWLIGKNKMKDWKAAVRTWEEKKPTTSTNEQKVKLNATNPNRK